MVKVKRLRSADCVVGGFRYESASRDVASLLLGLYDNEGKLNHVGFTTLGDRDRAALTRWSTERSGEWEPLRPQLVVEVRFDHVTGDRFRHGTKLLRWRPDKALRQCALEPIRAPIADPATMPPPSKHQKPE